MTDKRERQLIYKLQRKLDRCAADELIRKYYREIYVYIFRQIGEKENAMDVTQEVFLGMLQSIWSYDESKSGFRTWLYHIATHKVANYYRAKYRIENSRLDIFEEIQVALNQDMEQRIVDSELARQVFIKLAKEDVIIEELFRLRFYGEYTFSELAKILTLSESTVKTKYYTALKKLRKEFE